METNDAAQSPVPTRSNLGRTLAYAVGNFPTGVLLLVIGTWLMRLYCPSPDEGRSILVSPETFGRLSILVLGVAAIADPLVGYFSDRTRTRFGRRLPWIALGTPLLALSFAMLWFPPTGAASVANIVWLTLAFMAVHVTFTVVVNPYLALMPELWTSEGDRVKVSAWMSGANALAQVFAFGLGIVIVAFEGGTTILGLHLADGYKVGAVAAAGLTVLLFAPTLIWVRETPHSGSKDVPFGLVEAGRQTFRNPAFLPYIGAGSLLQAAQTMVVLVVPYVVAVLVGEGDDVTSYVLIALVGVSALCFAFVERLTERFGKRRLFIGSMAVFALVLPVTTGIGLIPRWLDLGESMLNLRLVVLVGACAFIAPALAVALVVPRAILSEVMDFDTKRTGYRREAMYNGMEGLIQKVAMALIPFAVGELFAAFGYSEERPWGIILAGLAGGLMALGGIVCFWFYPLRDKNGR